MCDANCNYAFFSYPPVNGDRLLELTEPLHFIADGCGNIRTDPADHGVRNGALACTDGDKAGLILKFKLVLPASVGCNLIDFHDFLPPVLTVVIDGNFVRTIPAVSAESGQPQNVFFYNKRICKDNLKPGFHCLTSISFADTDWGKISLGCECDQQDECQKVPTSLWLVSAEAVECRSSQ